VPEQSTIGGKDLLSQGGGIGQGSLEFGPVKLLAVDRPVAPGLGDALYIPKRFGS
jgi:hypothetical protein